MKVYQVSREFYPFANAGGLKEVVTGIATSLSRKGHRSSVFIPMYGFIEKTDDIVKMESFEVVIKGKSLKITAYLAHYLGVNVYMLEFPSIIEKNDIYTYTLADEEINSSFKKGSGFLDTDRINIVFQIAFIEYVSKYLEAPDILSLHDGHTGLIPSIIKSNPKYLNKFKDSKFFFTIHNAGKGYHQRFLAADLSEYNIITEDILCQGCFETAVDPLCLAILNSNALTVSPFYAKEILELKHEGLSDGFGQFCRKNNIKITGIINGVEINHYSDLNIIGLPEQKLKNKFKLYFEKYLNGTHKLNIWGKIDTIDKPLFIFQNRITEQKGIDKLINAVKKSICNNSKSNFIIMGQGEVLYEQMLIDLAANSNGNVCYMQGYDEIIAKKLFLASDFFILTSLWEPCGLTDFEAQLAGSIPIVHKTGGLKKVIHNRTGFSYSSFSELEELILNCENLYFQNQKKLNEIKREAFSLIENKYTWDKVVENEYLPIFKGLF